MELPRPFLSFVAEHGINKKVYDVDPKTIPRYLRTKDGTITIDELKSEFSIIEPVHWLESFYAIPSTTNLSTSDLYKSGKVYGLEASDHVLDLCCAPGAKLAMLADVIGKHGSVTGVDYSKSRISACKSVMHKYELINSSNPWTCRLFHADGRNYNQGAPVQATGVAVPTNENGILEVILDSVEITSRSNKTTSRKRLNKSARARLQKHQREATSSTNSELFLYDKVLVDAECTHDGSLRHLAKLTDETKWAEYLDNYLSPTHVENILKLQHDLIRNGFRLLAPGGRMVYSTCSLSIKQNEDIVRQFLKDTPSASLLPINSTDVPCQPGGIAHTVRFTPLEGMGGLYVALFTKIVSSNKGTKRQKVEEQA
ncbi:hypothetical protein THRCLA_03764 [Thraustotheca clavata]|uniref:SAM-dependent MTase RsmB/NOP-type domain-containing protein n=1 Tax=Thraustotheca clavata TaxID=74557 RepID=A0A1W0A0Z5_9STRA|nr:hypothetical protein THRCLA_03764 [Thraustotheca clavata]